MRYLRLLTGKGMRLMGMFLILSFSHFPVFLASCSESEDEEANEYSNWQARNEAYWLSMDDSLSRGGTAWRKIKSYTKDPTTEAATTEYIYVKVLETGHETESPLYTDTVRVSYRGRLIPSAQHAAGYVFDQTYRESFSWEATGVSYGVASGYVEGFTTALMQMHRGDRWRVYIPYQLGYNAVVKTGIPAYSTLIFDLALVDFWHPGETKGAWAARRH